MIKDFKEMLELPNPVEMMPLIKQFNPASTNIFTDPFSAILMLPLMPIIMLIQYQQTMFSQLFSNNSPKGKVTQIIRDKDALTIIEKYL